MALSKATPYPAEVLYERRPQRTFKGPDLLQIAMPLGGIGAGCMCLNGHGGLQDFSIHNHPSTSALDEGNNPGDAAFALLRIVSPEITRLVEGPLPVEKIYNQGIKAQGNINGGFEGLPRFRQAEFLGEYPFGKVTLTDPGIPLKVEITGFNPFIPLDDRDSSLPCAILEYRLENTSAQPVEYEFSYHLSHLAPGVDATRAGTSRNAVIPGIGAFLFNEEDPRSEAFGSAALGVVGHTPAVKAMWFRGGWFDSLSALWREVSGGQFQPNDGSNPAEMTGRNGGSILLADKLQPGEAVTYPIVVAWYFPNVHLLAGGVGTGGSGVFSGPSVRQAPGPEPAWQPYYAGQWQDARAVLEYVRDHYADLRSRTQAFHDALFSSTLPWYILDAVSANLAIVKSPTVLRQSNGNLWGWEGCFCERGCCAGSCTHVWNYAQAIPHLFPALERTFREQELLRSMDPNGHINFRSALPDGPTHHSFHAAADGQLGGIMKVYREWRISGDREWLEKMVPLAKQSLDYGIETWDPRRRGLVEEPHHNTYDIEFWGPDGMHLSFYLGALEAMAVMLEAVGRPEEAAPYRELAEKGTRAADEELFNGEYYEQKVRYRGLRDTSFAEFVDKVTDEDPVEDRLLRDEGPKYQYGQGCISDGVLGAWLAWACGFSTPQDAAKIRQNLRSIFEYNFKTTFWELANPQRPGYALGDEPGLLLCTWPRGGKPTLPFVYSDEVWTGIEYQVASHLIAAGLEDEGLTVAHAVRSRYEGHVRNPWNEYECGSYYARAMSSYALLASLSGFGYSAPEKRLEVAPRLSERPFRVFFSTATGWGTLELTEHTLKIHLAEGTLEIDELVVEGRQAALPQPLSVKAGAPAELNV